MRDWFPYGLDAPPVVRNLALAAMACWLVFALSFVKTMPLRIMGFEWPALAFSLSAISMVCSSRFGKLKRREKLLDLLAWRGDEHVLDIGCGRGLMAIAAARRVPRGRVTGVDIWQGEDLSGNGPEAVTSNAKHEGVADRVETRTADMRSLPFDDASIDTIVSSTAIHNIYQREERDRAIDEIVRVLKPHGQILIDDIRHLSQYAAHLRDSKFEVLLTRGVRSWFWRVVSLGNLAPGTIVGRKAAG